MIIILLTLTNLLILHSVSAGHASTWDYCNCRWETWSAWSDCSKSCGGGIKERDRRVWHKDIPECDGFEKCATPGSGWDRKACNMVCENGGSYQSFGSLIGFCRCPKGVKGSCCEQIVSCGRPSSISNGVFAGNDFSYNHQVRYTCNSKYNMSDSSKESRTCTENGFWSGKAPVCLYAMSCESSPCKNGATCVNLLGDYRCNCNSGWSGKNCDVDIQPPVVTGCPSNRHILTAAMTSIQNWSEPNITDPHGKQIHITKNYQKSKFEFQWGVFTIQYNAVKPSNGLVAECIFNISVKPFQCKKLRPPVNGIIVCNGWRSEYAHVCIYLCKNGFTLPPGQKQEDIYNCGATGHWLPSNPFNRCVSNDLFAKTQSNENIPVTFSTCTNATEKQDIGQFYITSLQKSPFNELCLNHAADCKSENVDIRC